MAQRTTTTSTQTTNGGHAHRTAKIIELIGVSNTSFEKAVQNAIEDANKSTRGITGAHVENFTVRVTNGKIAEYKVNLKVAFGIERTTNPN
jgi:hypothetical protein